MKHIRTRSKNENVIWLRRLTEFTGLFAFGLVDNTVGTLTYNPYDLVLIHYSALERASTVNSLCVSR